MGHGTHWEAVLKNFDGDFPAALDLGIQKVKLLERAVEITGAGRSVSGLP